MSDNKKYYYLKLKDNFFDSDEIKVLEAMPNGIYYSNLLLKLYLKSLKANGALMFNEFIPFNVDMIAAVTNLNIDTVRSGLDILSKMKLIDKLDNGTIFMSNIQNFIGKSSTEADRIRQYRQTIEQQKLIEDGNKVVANDVQMYAECTPENRDKSIENRDKSIDINISKDILSSNKLLQVIEAWNKLNLSQLVIIKPNSNRYKLIKARIKDVGLEKVIEAIESISKSDFLRGQNDRGWTINFDWLIKPNNFTKVLEGNYLNKGGNNNGANWQRNNRPDSRQNNGTGENKFAGFKPKQSNYELTDEERKRAEEEGLL